jgi:GNAT superfamily N-acetyltransferase
VSNVKRLQTIEEAERMIELGRLMHSESPAYKNMEFDEARMRAYARMAIDNPQDWGVFYVEDDEETVAMIAVFVSPKWFSGSYREANDMVFYARQDRRGGLAAARCLKAVEDWASKNNVDAVTITVSAGINDNAAVRLCQGVGFSQAGVIMSKELH